MSGPPVPPTDPNYALPGDFPDQPLRTGLAVTTLVMGILGLIACPIVALAAVVTGIIAIVQATQQPVRYGGRGMAIAGLVCGSVGAVCIGPMLLAILLPSLSRARELSKRMLCGTNLKAVGVALTIYRHDYAGQGLPTLERLVELDLINAGEIRCPSAPPGSSPNYILKEVEAADEADDAPVAYEPKSNHQEEGGNILFGDGHATFVKGSAYEDILGKSP